MRIFQLITLSEYGGAQSVVAALSRSLSAAGNEVFLVYGGEGRAWSGLDSGIKRLCYGKQRKSLSWRDIFIVLHLIYYRFRYRPDVVHLHSSKMGALGRLVFPKSKTVYTVHGFDSVRVAFRRFLPVERILAPHTGCVVGVSYYDRDGMKAEGFRCNPEVIHNGISDYTETAFTPSDTQPEEVLKHLKTRYKRIIMCISRISKQKHFELFVQVARQLPNYAFVWIGNETSPEGAVLSDNVFLLGSLYRPYYYLPYADVFMLPSHYEGLPVSIIEAFCFSTPVVASAVGGVSEVVSHGKNGYLLENTPDVFVAHLSKLLESDDLLWRFGREARKTYEQKFRLEQMLTKYEAIYEKIVHGRES
jgi:glycosyltransferase involved in cell wall biosynthesis